MNLHNQTMQVATHGNPHNLRGLQQWLYVVSGILGLSILAFLNLVFRLHVPLALILAVFLAISACVVFAKKPIYAFLVLILLLPFHTLAMSLLLTYGGVSDQAAKAIAAWKEAVVLVVLAAVVIRQLCAKERMKLTITDWLAISYLSAICVLGLVTAALQEARVPLLNRLYGMRDAGFLIVVYFTGRFTPIVSKELGKVLQALYAVGVFSALVGFFEYFFLPIEVLVILGYVNYTNWLGTDFAGPYGLPENLYVVAGGILVRRLFSIFLMSNVYAQCLILIIPAIAYIRATTSHRRALMATLALGVTLIALFLTITRASIVACVIGLCIVGYLLHDRFIRRVAGVITGAAVLGALGIALFRPSVGLVTTSDTSIISHFDYWAEAAHALTESPIIGMGAGSSGFASSRDLGGGLGMSWGGSENQYFAIGVQFGLIVLLLHLALIVAILRGSLKAFRAQSEWGPRGICLVAVAGGVGIALNAATTSTYAVTFPTFVFWWIAGMSIQMASKGEPKQIVRLPKQTATPQPL